MAHRFVKVTLVVPIEIPDDPDYDEHFDIEENHCPGTGIVGSAIQAMIDDCETKSVCWGCNFHGENKILSDKEYEEWRERT